MPIIPKKTPSVETHWQKELANSFTTLHSLLEYLHIDPNSLPSAVNINESENPIKQTVIPSKNVLSIVEQHSQARTLFPMRVPKPFADLMQAGNWHDPLLQQVVPQQAEFIKKLGFVSDPLQEQGGPTAGLIHKYKSRILLIVRGGCAVNCRYCFRRHFPYQDNQLGQAQYQSAIDYVKKDTSINEVIFSGGDPLMANDQQLAKLAKQLDEIAHVKRLRIHTRLPVVIPSRVNDDFIAWLKDLRVKPVIVLHINHKNEVSDALIEKTKALMQAGVTLLNQSVLLKNVNDSSDIICELSEALFNANILPYYLHILDPVKGASHFDVSKTEAKNIMADVIKRLPGFLVPKLVQELPGQPGKTPIDLGLEP
ncbi:MAG: EF-P beta-lysylation protein EpmB [Alphaproteobacteria bacterium]|jgi:EF-P beta-lysylation protein EpmB